MSKLAFCTFSLMILIPIVDLLLIFNISNDLTLMIIICMILTTIIIHVLL